MTIAEVLREKEPYLPESIRMLFPQLTEPELEKVFALNTLLHSAQPFEDFYVFEDIVLALNGISPDFSAMQGCTPEQIFYAFYIAGKLSPEPFYYDWEIKQWAKFSLNNEGVYFYPPELGYQDKNPIVTYEEVEKKALEGPFPLGETVLEIQASKYLAIQNYINTMIARDSWSSKEF